jgi:hypothetical protein
MSWMAPLATYVCATIGESLLPSRAVVDEGIVNQTVIVWMMVFNES